LVKELGNVIDFNLSHLQNISLPFNNDNLSGKFKDNKLLHPKKHLWCISCSVSGNDIADKLIH
jgi:hypothetical protein